MRKLGIGANGVLMQKSLLAERISGCYIPIPTLFRDGDLELNLPAMQKHVRFLIDGGARGEKSAILVGGGAGEFHTMNVEERLRIAETVVQAADGQVPVILGVQ